MQALVYDVHGNLPALEAVLEDCPAHRFLLGGFQPRHPYGVLTDNIR